jgi:alkylated DNA repair dioxygenase AlkB
MQAILATPDSYIQHGYLQANGVNTVQLWEDLLQLAPWVDRADPCMLYRGNQLKRGKFFLMAGEPGTLYKYSYPGFQWASMLHYRHWDTVPTLKAALQGLTIRGEPARFNHIIGTLYTEDTDEICAHSDRMADIEAGTDIISLSFGDKREFELTAAGQETGHIEVLSDGDLFVLGPQTNASMKHAVLPVAKERVLQRGGERQQPRISVVLRQI